MADQANLVELVDDVTAPVQTVRVLGHVLRLNGRLFDVAIAARWTGYNAERLRLIEQGDAAGVLELLFSIFRDAILPANRDWTEERLREAFPVPAQVKVLQHFFTWRMEELEIEVIPEPQTAAEPTPLAAAVPARRNRRVG